MFADLFLLFLGYLFPRRPSLLAAPGLIAILGCAANTPLTTIMLGIQLFGLGGLPYYITMALISYYISVHNGIYASQLIAISKYHYLKEHTGQTLSLAGNKGIMDLMQKLKWQESH